MAVKKTEYKTIRFEPDNYDWLQTEASAEGVDLSKYIRQVVLCERPQASSNFSKLEHTQAVKNFRKELRHIGNNVNQMTRIAHTSGGVNPERLDEIREQLINLKKRIEEEL